MGIAIGGIISLFSLFATAIGAVFSVIGVLLSPIGLIAAAVVALGVAMVQAFGGVGAVVDWLKGKLGEFGESAGKIIAPIIKAFKSGNVSLAAKVMWLNLKVVWLKGVEKLGGSWSGFLLKMHKLMIVVGSAIKSVFSDIVDSAAKAILKITDVMNAGSKGKAQAKMKLAYEISRVEKKAGRQKALSNRSGDEEGAKRIAIEAEKAIGKLKLAFEREYGTSGLAEKGGALIDGDKARTEQKQANEMQEKFAELERNSVTPENNDLEKATAELATALQSVEDINKGEGGEDVPSVGTLAGDFKSLMSGIKGGELAKSGISAVGSFSAAAIGLGGQSAHAERTAKFTEQTAKNTKKLLTSNKSLVFG